MWYSRVTSLSSSWWMYFSLSATAAGVVLLRLPSGTCAFCGDVGLYLSPAPAAGGGAVDFGGLPVPAEGGLPPGPASGAVTVPGPAVAVPGAAWLRPVPAVGTGGIVGGAGGLPAGGGTGGLPAGVGAVGAGGRMELPRTAVSSPCRVS